MNIKNPYSLTEGLVKENANKRITELFGKGLTLEQISKNLKNGIASCDRRIKRNSFNLDAIQKKEWLIHQLNALNKRTL